MDPTVVRNFLFKPMERFWDDFEPTLNHVKKDLTFINGFIKDKKCSQYEMSALDHAKTFGAMILRYCTVPHTSIKPVTLDHVFKF